jgi:glycerol-3-phosphate dehydrogenase (NAD(P)+)
LNVSILGCGRWGAFLAWYACRTGHRVRLWGREQSESYRQLASNRNNEYLTLPNEVRVDSSLADVLQFGEIILISISAQQLRELARRLKQYPLAGKAFVLCMKGLEAETGKRLTQVLAEELGGGPEAAIWVGPGHVQDFVRGTPNCMVIGSVSIDLTKRIVENFNSDLIRFYYGQDLIGNEIGAAAKNVMGIAAGMLDGLNFGSLKGALMARGTREISRLVRAMGGNELTIYGLSHLGDYEATLFSPHSHNRRFGEAYIRGERFEKLAEGVPTIRGLRILSERYEVDLPICDTLHAVINEGRNPAEALLDLFLRPVKFEF